MEWKKYTRKRFDLERYDCRPYSEKDKIHFNVWPKIRINEKDRSKLETGRIKGGMIVRNPKNHLDQRYVNQSSFDKYYEVFE